MFFLDSSDPKEITDIIVGSARHLIDVNEALSSGAHIVTVPPPILREMLHNPKADETIREFNDAWAHRQGRAQ